MLNKSKHMKLILVVLSLMLLSQLALVPSPAAGAVSTGDGPDAQLDGQLIYVPLAIRSFPATNVFGISADLGSPTGVDEMAQAGTRWVRQNSIFWSRVEANKGERNWDAALDAQLVRAAENNMRVVLIVQSAPVWAQKSVPGTAKDAKFCGPIKDEELAAFGQFMYDAVRRYSYAPYNVKDWEIWNEPDINWEAAKPDQEFGCWGDPSDAYFGGGYFAEMLKAVYPRIKDANPDARVITGGLVMDCDPNGGCPAGASLQMKFLEGILRHNGANDGHNFFDGISFHAYDSYGDPRNDPSAYYSQGKFSRSTWKSYWNTTGPVTIAKARFIKDVLQQYNVTGKFLMNTETAIICGGFDDQPGLNECNDAPNSDYELTKAYYLAQVYAASIAEGLEANIWYSLFGWRNSSILYGDASPRPAFLAYTTASRQLTAATFQRELTQFPGVAGYEFVRADGLPVWVVWSRDGASHSINLGVAPRWVFDALGLDLPASALLDVGMKPLYIVR